MSLKVRFGDGWSYFNLPEGFELSFIAEPKEASSLSLTQVVKEALEKPVENMKLRELIKPGLRVALLVDDHTRPTPVSEVYRILSRELEEASEVKVVVALGLHEPPTYDKLLLKLGRELVEEAIMHNPDGDLLNLGKTLQGTSVYINRFVVEADLRVSLGTINPHPFSGYSGGPKMLIPGVSGRETVEHNHSLILHPKAYVCQLEENPVYLDEVYAAKKLPTFILNLLPSPAEGYMGAVAGEAVKAHLKGVEKHGNLCLFRLSRPVDVAVATSYLADVSPYQAWKGVFSVSRAVKDGGAIILASPCYEGVPKDKAEVIKKYQLHRLTLPEIYRLAVGRTLPDYILSLIYLKLRKEIEGKELIVVTDGVDEREVEALGFSYAPSIEDALKKLKRRMGKAEVLVNPHGAEVAVRVG